MLGLVYLQKPRNGPRRNPLGYQATFRKKSNVIATIDLSHNETVSTRMIKWEAWSEKFQKKFECKKAYSIQYDAKYKAKAKCIAEEKGMKINWYGWIFSQKWI